MRILLILLICNGWFQGLIAQEDSTTLIKASEISSTRYLRDVETAYVDKEFDVETGGKSIPFINGLANKGIVGINNINKKAVARFTIINDADTSRVFYFFPGFFFEDSRLYQLEDEKLVPLPSVAPDVKDNAAIREISLKAGDTATFIAEAIQVKTYNNRFTPRLINPLYLEAHLGQLHNSNKIEAFITYIFCGLLLMMILFSIATYSQGGNKEFLYYAGYAFFLGFMLFTKPHYNLRSDEMTFFFEGYLDFILQCIGICFYMAFMMRFLATKQKYPFLHGLYKYSIIGLLLAMVVFTWFHYGTDNFFLENLVENYITKGLLLVLMVVFLVYAHNRWSDQLLRYLFWGNLLYLIFAIISLGLILAPSLRQMLPGVFRSALLYYEIGIFLELVFFLMGLAYKNRRQIIEQTKEKERLKIENEKKELEKQLAVMAAHQDERNRISADMHDELGSGMTTIRLMSEIAKNKMKDQVPVEIEKISHSANDLLNKMNAIIWSMNSDNDTLDSLISYLRSYALEYMEGTPIRCKVITPEFIEKKDITGDKRRNIFLCVKETLNNALKHSQATEMKIEIEANGLLRIRISDNGKGVDLDNVRQFGNGLKNIARRMERIGGNFKIGKKDGTITILELPL